jgi:hypothetical protein
MPWWRFEGSCVRCRSTRMLLSLSAVPWRAWVEQASLANQG